jgi:hypothetical protein
MTRLLLFLADLLLLLRLWLHWPRHEREAFKAANRADYLNTEHGTNYTPKEIERLFNPARQASRARNYQWN